ncbi:beta-N-acetylhexosaminidase [uncultured Ezakiella sp.]|uniref:beta-N-acetylhexosaminidase n=1 Tax=uncultured Ezakiella sp. TaxID=1637529 RepID=UPI0025D3373C|nr:beta-N-acetylhexosaminidase [uncultured Ezakiella sp.]
MNKIFIFLLIFSFLGCKVDESKLSGSKEIVDTGKGKINTAHVIDFEKEREKYTKDDKIGQLICVGIESTTLDDQLKAFIDKYKPGSIILFKRNIQSSKQLETLNESIKGYYKNNNYIEPFIFVDQEGGRVDRLKDVSKPMKSAYWYANNSSPEQYASDLNTSLKSFHIDSPLAPVLDTNPANASGAIGDRAFSSDYNTVSKFARGVIEAMDKEKLLSVAKHYPGHGATRVDSHKNLPVINKSYEDLLKSDLIPFKENLDIVDGIMIGHILVPDVDNMPASLSKIWIDKLRGDGFDGLVLSDDLTMNALNAYGSLEERFIKFINAGGDIGLVCHDLNTIPSIFEAMKNIDDTRINESFERIVRTKDEKFTAK